MLRDTLKIVLLLKYWLKSFQFLFNIIADVTMFFSSLNILLFSSAKTWWIYNVSGWILQVVGKSIVQLFVLMVPCSLIGHNPSSYRDILCPLCVPLSLKKYQINTNAKDARTQRKETDWNVAHNTMRAGEVPNSHCNPSLLQFHWLISLKSYSTGSVGASFKRL